MITSHFIPRSARMCISRRSIIFCVYGAFIQKRPDRPREGLEMTENEQGYLKMSERCLSRCLFPFRNRHEIASSTFIFTISGVEPGKGQMAKGKWQTANRVMAPHFWGTKCFAIHSASQGGQKEVILDFSLPLCYKWTKLYERCFHEKDGFASGSDSCLCFGAYRLRCTRSVRQFHRSTDWGDH